jgi:DNA (cytosine-5)-methyltransferase 1
VSVSKTENVATAYYNEWDPYAAAWLRNLIAEGLLPDGDVDETDIRDVYPLDLVGYTQCHFFAGIGGWPLALRRAGWPDDRDVWTGSCPCQPFSTAGAGGGFADERHLWPFFHQLIRVCRPHVVFGEQVEVAVAHGWLDIVCDDLAGEGYTCGAVATPACGVGAPHIRQRLWWVADNMWAGRSERRAGARDGQVAGSGGLDGVADTNGARSQGRFVGGDGADERAARPAGLGGFWSDAEWLPCRDGKARPTKPGIFPLAHGVPARVGKLRAAGNAIVPQVAEDFIRAYCESR